MWKWLYSIILSCFIGICFTQKPMIQLIVEPKVAQVGEEITITVKSNISGNLEIDLPSSYTGGGSVSSITENDNTSGEWVTYMIHSQNGYFTHEGTVTLGPAYIKKGRKVFKSNSVTIKIEKEAPKQQSSSGQNLAFSNKQLSNPAFGVIEKSKSKIYEGEPLILTAKVYSRFSPTDIGEYQSYEIDGVLEKHPIKNSQTVNIEEKNLRGMILYCFDLDKQLVFPIDKGKIIVKPYKLNLLRGFEGYSFASTGASVFVESLPSDSPKDFNGGVGRFTITQSIKESKFIQGGVVELTVKLSGLGNIHSVSKPKLHLPEGMSQYGDVIVKEDFTFGERGSEGDITYMYNIQLMKDGGNSIPAVSISYFDVNKEQYVTIKDVEIKINVERNTKFAAINNSVDNVNVLPVSEKVLVRSLSKQNVPNSITISSYLLIFILLFMVTTFFLVYYLYKKKSKNTLSFINPPNKANHTHYKEEAIKQLKIAENTLSLGRVDEFYISIQNSILYGCSFLLNQSDSSFLSKLEIIANLEIKKIDESLINDVKSIFEAVESARYGMSTDESEQLQLLLKTKECISKLVISA